MLRLIAGYQVLDDEVGSLGFLPDGRLFCSTVDESDDADADLDEDDEEEDEGDVVGVLKIWHPESGAILTRRKFDYGSGVAASTDGRWIAWGGDYGRLCLVDTGGSRRDRTLQIPNMPATERPDGITCGPTNGEFVFRLNKSWWRWSVKSKTASPFSEAPFLGPLAFSKDKRRFASIEPGGANDRIYWWDMERGQPIVAVPSHDNDTKKVVWHPSKPLLAVCSWWDGGFSVWDFSNLAAPRQLMAEKSACSDVVFLHDGHLVTGHGSGAVKIWDVASGRLIAEASSSELGELKLIEEADQIAITEDRPEVCVLAVSADGTALAAGTTSGVVLLFDVNRI